MMKEKIKKIVEEAVMSLGKEIADVSIEIPSDKRFGDYSTNAAFLLSKKIGENLIETADLIKEKLDKNPLFKEVRVAGPGFINFFIADKFDCHRNFFSWIWCKCSC